MNLEEKARQDQFPWARSGMFGTYSGFLAHYQAQACLEHSRGDSLLDMPCGDGLLTSMLADKFRRVVGVDASAKHVGEARLRLPCVEFHEALIEEFRCDQRFSTITMLNVLEHVEDPVLALRKTAQLLEDDGVLIVHVPNAKAVNRRLAVLMGTLEDCEELSPFDIHVAGHRRSYTMDSFLGEFEKAGLVVRNTGGVFYKMLSMSQMDWFLENGPWKEGGFGWGRVGGPEKDWKAEFCRASYELGKERPEDCNIIYACATAR